MATSLVVTVIPTLLIYDPTVPTYRISWDAQDDDGHHYGDVTNFGATDSPAVINDRLIADAKAKLNDYFSAGLGPSAPARLFGGVAL